MISQLSISGKIYDAIVKAKDLTDAEYEDASEWITDIIENPDRAKKNECEICSSNKKLEQHHVRGRKHGNECITVCQECHKTLTDKQRLWDRAWLDIDAENKDAFLILGIIIICELKNQKTGKEIFKKITETLTGGFRYE